MRYTKLIRARARDGHTLAGAYALDAISDRDRDRFERHLAGCAECAQEIAGLREATALLGAAAAEPLPAGLKERVLAAAPVPSMAVASRRLATSRAHSSHPARCRSNRSRSGAEIASIAYAPASV